MENLPDGIAKYTWIPFYERLADRLLEYRDDRQSLIEKICAAFGGMGMELPKLDSTPVPVDIDPYTVYGLFNKGISEPNRCKIAGALARELRVDEELPQDFAGIPVVNNLNATFYDHAHACEERCELGRRRCVAECRQA